MNKLLFPLLNLLLVVSLLLTSSCTDDGEEVAAEAPSFAVSGVDNTTTATVDAGNPVRFNMAVNAPGGLKSLMVTQKKGTAGAAETFFDYTPSGQTLNSYPYEFEYTPAEADAGQQLIFDFVATDKANQTASYQYTINVNAQPEPEVVSFSELKLYAPTANLESKTWLNTTTGELFSSKEVTGPEVSEGIDIGYFWGTNMHATLASPSFYPKADFGQASWERRNVTSLRNTTLSPEDFQNITTQAQLAEAFENALTSADGDPNATFHQDRVFQLQKDKVVVFKTDAAKAGGSRYGIVLVSDIVGTTAATDYMQLEMKVAQSATTEE